MCEVRKKICIERTILTVRSANTREEEDFSPSTLAHVEITYEVVAILRDRQQLVVV